MLELKKYTFNTNGEDTVELIRKRPGGYDRRNETKKMLKKELLNVFQRFGYLGEAKDYEVRIRTTSGNVAWININSIETIK